MNPSRVTGTFAAGVAAVLLAVTMFVPWAQLELSEESFRYDSDAYLEIDYFLWHLEATSLGRSESIGWWERGMSHDGHAHVRAAGVLATLTLALAAGSTAVLALFGTRPGGPRAAASTLGAVGGVAGATAILLFHIGVNAYTEPGWTILWRAGLILSSIAAGLLLVAGSIGFVGGRTVRRGGRKMRRLRCRRCSTEVTVPPGESPRCPKCGFGS